MEPLKNLLNTNTQTDIAWASKQAKSMSSMFEAFPTAKYKFEIPRYSGQEKLEVK